MYMYIYMYIYIYICIIVRPYNMMQVEKSIDKGRERDNKNKLLYNYMVEGREGDKHIYKDYIHGSEGEDENGEREGERGASPSHSMLRNMYRVNQV
jgi:hypothetical protein